MIIYPDWDGISNYERFRAHLLANMGYTGAISMAPSTPSHALIKHAMPCI